jgi:hypothetical protein
MITSYRDYLKLLFVLLALYLYFIIALKYPIPGWVALHLHHVGAKFLLLTLFLLSLFLVIMRRFKRSTFLLKSYRIKPINLILFLCFTTFLLGTLPVFIYWSAPWATDPNYSSNYHVMGGHVPWSDAASFLTSAHNLIFDGALPSGCYRRPLNAAFLATRLFVTGFDYNYALLLQGIIFGVACLLCSTSVSRTHGWAAGAATYAIVYSWGAYFLPTIMTETLGLTLGALAFTALWTGFCYNRFYIYSLGLGLFCLSQIARPGPILIILSLLIVGLSQFKDKCFSFKLFFMLGLAIIPGLLVDKLILLFYGNPSANATVGNFSYLLYGISVGDKGYIQVFKDYPELYSMDFDKAEAFIYKKILQNLISSPVLFIQGLTRTFEFGAVKYMIDFKDFVIGGITCKMFYLLVILPIYILLSSYDNLNLRYIRNYLRTPKYNSKFFFVIILIGFFVSLAFIYRDGGMRSTATSVPFFAVLIAIVFYPRHIYVLEQPSKKNADDSESWQRYHAWGPAILGTLIVISALIGPIMAHKFVAKPPPSVNIDCGVGEEKKVIAILAMAYTDIPKDKPYLSVHEANENIASWKKVASPATIFFAYNAIQRTSFFGYGPPGFAEKKDPYITVCASKVAKGLWKIIPY